MTESADVPRYETPGFQQVLRKNQPKSAESDPRLNSIETDVGKNLTYNIFTKMEERSKSRTVGFKDVKSNCFVMQGNFKKKNRMYVEAH